MANILDAMAEVPNFDEVAIDTTPRLTVNGPINVPATWAQHIRSYSVSIHVGVKSESFLLTIPACAEVGTVGEVVAQLTAEANSIAWDGAHSIAAEYGVDILTAGAMAKRANAIIDALVRLDLYEYD